MKQTVNFSQFCDAFAGHERTEQFSYEAKRAIFDYIERLEEDTGEETELDVVAICCAYTEYANIEEFQADYDAEDYPDMESIENKTSVIAWTNTPEDDGFVIQQF